MNKNPYNIRINSLVYIVFGITLLILGLVGQIYLISTLKISMIIGVICLVLSFINRSPFFLRLIDVWISAYLYFYLGEYILLRDVSLLPFGMAITSITEGFIVASFGASLLGYGLVVNYFMAKWVPSLMDQSRGSQQSNMFFLPVVFHRQKLLIYANPNLDKEIPLNRELIPSGIGLFSMALSIIILLYIFRVVTLQQLFFVGRAYRAAEVDVGVARIFLQAAIVVFPALTVFLLMRYRLLMLLKGWLLIVTIWAVVVTFAWGTRFLIGYQAASVLFLVTRGFRLRVKQSGILLTMGFLLLLAQEVILSTRNVGIGHIDLQQLLSVVSQPDNYLGAEGILRVNAWIHLSQAYTGNGHAPENLFLLYWWIPRQWWPDKPVAAGYWVIRELSSLRGFGITHSVSGGFGMPALLDFGPIGGTFFSIVYGIGIGAFEAYVQRYRNRLSPEVILAGLMYFGVFLMMRSLFTSLIFMIIASLVIVIPLLILE